LEQVALSPGHKVLDVGCGPGVLTLPAAQRVGPTGSAVGLDISEAMVASARLAAGARGLWQASFQRADLETTGLPAASMDAVVCAFGLMYAANRAAGLREMRRVLRPGGRLAVSVWGRRERCGFADMFPIVDRQVSSEVCPTFFAQGVPGALRADLALAGFTDIEEARVEVGLCWPDARTLVRDMFEGGPVALAWSRFSSAVRDQVAGEFLAAVDCHRQGAQGYRLPCEVAYASGRAPAAVTAGEEAPAALSG
jgi:SAM-dependent methyltransferase